MSMNRRQFITASAAMAGIPALASKPVYQSTVERVALLELFTSEGCSSCPPAEEWFSKLRDAPGLWTQFIPMAFHVDYWDYLGWKDGFASAAFTKRQHEYAARWRSNSVYTPGFVMNGSEWREKRLALPEAEQAGVLALTPGEKGTWLVQFDPSQGGKQDLVFHVVLLGSATSKVTAGENSGRVLQHDFTVLKHVNAAAENGRALLKMEGDARGKAVAAWVSRGADPTPVQAVGGWL